MYVWGMYLQCSDNFIFFLPISNSKFLFLHYLCLHNYKLQDLGKARILSKGSTDRGVVTSNNQQNFPLIFQRKLLDHVNHRNVAAMVPLLQGPLPQQGIPCIFPLIHSLYMWSLHSFSKSSRPYLLHLLQ